MSNTNDTNTTVTDLRHKAEKRLLLLMENGEAALNCAAFETLLNERHHINVIVHDGAFHADEALSVALLELLVHDLDKEGKVRVIRTRDAAFFDDADLVIDVGEGLLDHHGKRAAEGRCAFTLLLDAFQRSVKMEDGVACDTYTIGRINELAKDVAGIDTGVEGSKNHFEFVNDLCRLATSKGIGKPDAEAAAIMDEYFQRAVDYCRERLEVLDEIWSAESNAYQVAAADVDTRIHDRYVVFCPSARMAPCKEMLHAAHAACWFYISQESEHDWRVLCTANPEEPFSFFNSWHLIPERFRGLRCEELSAATGIEGAIFCHAAGFIAGWQTQEAAETFAKLCVREIEEAQ